MTDQIAENTLYFTLRELGVILLIALLAAVSGALVPSWLFPEGTVSTIVYGWLGLPGPGAGVLIFGSILCFWLLAGRILVGKPGTAATIAIAIIAIDLLFGSQTVLVQVLDVILIVAVIIEAVLLLPAVPRSWNRVLPAALAALSLYTLVIAAAGMAAAGEADAAVSGIPYGYYLFGIAGLCIAAGTSRIPPEFTLAAGIANLYYLLHFWLFWGSSFAGRFPPDPAMIPVLLLVALAGGVVAAAAAVLVIGILAKGRISWQGTSSDQ